MDGYDGELLVYRKMRLIYSTTSGKPRLIVVLEQLFAICDGILLLEDLRNLFQRQAL